MDEGVRGCPCQQEAAWLTFGGIAPARRATQGFGFAPCVAEVSLQRESRGASVGPIDSPRRSCHMMFDLCPPVTPSPPTSMLRAVPMAIFREHVDADP